MTQLDELKKQFESAETQLDINWQEACTQFEQLAATAEAALPTASDRIAVASIAAESLYEVAYYYGNAEDKRSKARKIWQRGRKHLNAVLPEAADTASRAKLLNLLGHGYFDEAYTWQYKNKERILAGFEAAFDCFSQAYAQQPSKESAFLAAESLRLQNQDNGNGYSYDDPPDCEYYLPAADEWYQRALNLAENAEKSRIWYKLGRMYALEGEYDLAEPYLYQAVYTHTCDVQAACQLAKVWLGKRPAESREQILALWQDTQTLMAYAREQVPDDAQAWWGSANAFRVIAEAFTCPSLPDDYKRESIEAYHQLIAEQGCPMPPNDYRAAQQWCIQAALLDPQSTDCLFAWCYLISTACEYLSRQDLLDFLAETESALHTILPDEAKSYMTEELYDHMTTYWSYFQPDAYPRKYPPITESEHSDSTAEEQDKEEPYSEAEYQAVRTENQARLTEWLNDTAMPNRTLFVQWLLALYNDDPYYPAVIVQDWQDEYGYENEDFSSDNLIGSFFALHNLQPDHSRLFAVDWKDGESFINYAQDVSDRFGITLQWQTTDALPDELLPQFAAQIAGHAAVFSLHTGGDYYYVAIVEHSQTARFTEISDQWELGYDLISGATPSKNWLGKIIDSFAK